MKPEEVPAELTRLAADALIIVDYPPNEWPDGSPGEGEMDHAHELAAAALAAVLPEHREQIAKEIEVHGKALMDKAISQVIGDEEGGLSATFRAAAVSSAAKLVRGGS